MSTGMVFDIKEFSINDGPGVRTTVFLKGCPLRCVWCHNPEGISPKPQINNNSKEIKGKEWTADELVKKLITNADIFEMSSGGITFSGGEPTFQYDFLKECAEKLKGIHLLLDTSGLCEEEKFIDVARMFNQIYFDLKLATDDNHIKYTGASNRIILNNLENVCKENLNLTIRLPMIPGITDVASNLTGIADIVQRVCPKNTLIHLIPYNRFAEGKYSAYGMEYGLKNWYRVNNKDNIKRFAMYMRANGYKVENYLEKEN